MAKTDFTYCQGVHCPNRLQCKRFVDGLDAMKDKKNHDYFPQMTQFFSLIFHSFLFSFFLQINLYFNNK